MPVYFYRKIRDGKISLHKQHDFSPFELSTRRASLSVLVGAIILLHPEEEALSLDALNLKYPLPEEKS